MALHKEQEGVCRELGNPRELARCLALQASLLASEMNRPREALPLAEEAYRLANEHGVTALARRIEPLLKSVRSMLQ